MHRHIATALVLTTLMACRRTANRSFNERFEIAPGQRALIDTIVGSPASRPGGCAFQNVTIGRTYFQARYSCPNRHEPSVVEFRHREVAPRGAPVTQFFTLIPFGQHGVPQALLDALLTQTRAHESAWRWITHSSDTLTTVTPTATPDVQIAIHTSHESSTDVPAIPRDVTTADTAVTDGASAHRATAH